MEEFDLLGHLHDAESSGLAMQQQTESVQVLLWKKLEINGYLPAAREVYREINACLWLSHHNITKNRATVLSHWITKCTYLAVSRVAR